MKSPAELAADKYYAEWTKKLWSGLPEAKLAATIGIKEAVLYGINFVLAFAEEHHSDIRSADWLIEKLKSLKAVPDGK